MPIYNFYTGLKHEEFKTIELKNVELDSFRSAHHFAGEFAKEQYYLNPKRDILEIMKEDSLDEARATTVFMKEMYESISYKFSEVKEISGEVIEIDKYFVGEELQ